ncbi:MAG: hypothetical protein IIW75_02420, partial [Bacteroidaceae bacterium]|nr:hypothetical protein [Bacteroidaceae bacterium]
NEILEQMMRMYISQDEDEMRDAGILSYDINVDGSVYIFNILLDEDVTYVETMGELMSLAKKKAATGEIFSYDDYETIEQMESLGITFRYIVRGNRTGKRVVHNFTMREFLAFEKLSADDSTFGDEMSIDDIVRLLDKTLAAEDESMRCVRRGKVVYIEQEVPANDYDDIKYVMEDSPELMKNIFQEMMASDPDAVEVFRSITKKGYRLAYSVKCGSKQPIVLELDF